LAVLPATAGDYGRVSVPSVQQGKYGFASVPVYAPILAPLSKALPARGLQRSVYTAKSKLPNFKIARPVKNNKTSTRGGKSQSMIT